MDGENVTKFKVQASHKITGSKILDSFSETTNANIFIVNVLFWNVAA